MKISKNFKISFLAVLSTSFIYGLYKFNDFLSKEKRWFYATATDIKAFDKLYWGMSKEEVERAYDRKLRKSVNLYIPGRKKSESIAEFKNQYELEYGFEYSPEIASKIEVYQINDISNLLGVYIEHYNVWFIEDKLYRINLRSEYKSKSSLQNDEFRLEFMNELNRKYNFLNKNKSEFNDFKNYKDIFVVQGKTSNKTDIWLQFYSYKKSDDTYLVDFFLEMKDSEKINDIKVKIRNYRSELF